MIRVVIDGKVYIGDNVQVKTFDKKVLPEVYEGGIGNTWSFRDSESVGEKFRKVMQK